jgi:Zn-dependent protease
VNASDGQVNDRCRKCGVDMPSSFVACPVCLTLVHGDRLQAMAAQATQAQSTGDLAGAIEIWTTMLDLLPPGSVQHKRIEQMIADAQAQLATPTSPASSAPSARPTSKRRTGLLVGLGAVALLLVKFKWVLIFLLGKGKLLLLGLLQAKTFLSMGLALLVYITAWGWKFALGLVASIYVHEMGHVARLRHYGIPATAPMFIPGVGAFVRLRQSPRSPAEDASIGLAGPLWGLAAALVCLLVGTWAAWPSWTAMAAVGAWINIFNLLPIWQLDGGRAWNALSRAQRGWTTAVLWALALWVGEGLFFILAVVASLRALAGKAPEQGDRGATWTYLGIALALTIVIYLAGLGTGGLHGLPAAAPTGASN